MIPQFSRILCLESQDRFQNIVFEVKGITDSANICRVRIVFVDVFGTRVLCSEYKELMIGEGECYILFHILISVEAGFYGALGVEVSGLTEPESSLTSKFIRYAGYSHWRSDEKCDSASISRQIHVSTQLRQMPQIGKGIPEWARLLPLDDICGYTFAKNNICNILSEFGLNEVTCELSKKVIGQWQEHVALDLGSPTVFSEIGEKTSYGIVARNSNGLLMFGPYLPLMSGKYRLAILLDAEVTLGKVSVDVVCMRGGTILMSPIIVELKMGRNDYIFSFISEKTVLDLEVRIVLAGNSDVTLCGVIISPETDSQNEKIKSIIEFSLLASSIGGSVLAPVVSEVYRHAFGRPPTSTELCGWAGKSLYDLTTSLNNTNEHKDYILTRNFVNEIRYGIPALTGTNIDDNEIRSWLRLIDFGYPRAKELFFKLAVAMRFIVKNNSFNDSAGNSKIIVLVYDGKKDYDSLFPINMALDFEFPDVSKRYISLDDFLEAIPDLLNVELYIVVANEYVDRLVRLTKISARYIYFEHGVCPLKSYTYGSHYSRYDRVYLPGLIWVNRLLFLYPNLSGKCFVVGYPKLRNDSVRFQNRNAYCKKFGLREEKPIVLFAPTWGADLSGNNKGINNIRYLNGIDNIIAVPHEGDVAIAKLLIEEYPLIYILDEGESISDHYQFADLLVTDISSTAIEFSRLGKAVVSINLGDIPDYEMQYMSSSGLPGVPYTQYLWDFCPYVRPEELAGTVLNLLAEQQSCNGSLGVPEAVELMCSCYGDEASHIAAKYLVEYLHDD